MLSVMNAALIPTAMVVGLCIDIFGDKIHNKRCQSIAYGALGAMHADNFSVSGIGRGLARARGTSPKHGVKQVDRLLSNDGIEMKKVFAGWIPWVIGNRQNIVVALDWTEHDHDGHSTIALYLITKHGRATPLLWKTVSKTKLKNRRNDYEDELLVILRSLVPEEVKVTLLADRGFGDTALYNFLAELNFDYIIRFRGIIKMVTEDGREGPTQTFLATNGKATRYNNVRLTWRKRKISAVVTVHDRDMKDAWYLATSLPGSATAIVRLYGRRFTIEETFRDTKDLHFGMGLSWTHIKDPLRRDRVLVLAAIAQTLMTILGRAGETLGLDRHLKVNTVKSRVLSLFRQGREYIRGALFTMTTTLRDAFIKLLKLHQNEERTYAWI